MAQQDVDYRSRVQNDIYLDVVAWRCRTVFSDYNYCRDYIWTLVTQPYVELRIEWVSQLDLGRVIILLIRLITAYLG